MDTVTATEALARAPGDPWRIFDRWSSNLLLLLAVLSLLAILSVGPAVASYQPIILLATIAIAGLGLVVLYIAAAGLDRERLWARPTAFGLLVVLVVTGLVSAAVDVANGRIPIPLGVIAGAVVLSHKPGPLPAIHARDRGMAVGLSAVYLAASLGVGAPAWLATSPDSPLTVGSDALDLRLVVACPGSSGATRRIPVAVSWTWRQWDALAAGADGVVVAWALAGQGDDFGLMADEASIQGTELVRPGYSSPWADAIRGVPGDARQVGWSIDVEGGGRADTSTAFDLVPVDANRVTVPEHGLLTVWAVYAHLDRWTVRQETTCDW